MRSAREHGISFTEFSYMLLQANDFLQLYEHLRLEIQIGGSDQWGNIIAGVDLIRRRLGAHGHASPVPLITKADGSKFGKSAGGAVWLDPATHLARTSSVSSGCRSTTPWSAPTS